MKRLAIVGSTGSIGTQTLEVVDALPNQFEVVSLVCNNNVELLAMQIMKYNPRYAAVVNEEKEKELKNKIRGVRTTVVSGAENAITISTGYDIDMVVNAAVGIAGLDMTMAAIENCKTLAFANKESLVTAGKLVMDAVKRNNANLRHPIISLHPIDSEPNGVWQIIQGEKTENIEKILLTGSGGPFRRDPKVLRDLPPEAALKHPKWVMGQRITIDSATMMNKGFEIIEMSWLFNIPQEKIEVLVHPQSENHSTVCFVDGTMKASLGPHDMRLPIQYALTYPNREPNKFPRLELRGKTHEYYNDEPTKFICLQLARSAMHTGGTATAVLNGADEKAVGLYLKGKIEIQYIPYMIGCALKAHEATQNPTISQIKAADVWAKAFVDRKYSEKFERRSKVKSA